MSEGFNELLKAVKSFSTLPMVIFNQEKIFEILKSHIERHDPLYLEPLFDLMTGMAQDLQHSFVKYYPDFIRLVADTSRLTKK